jgi:uncharacterized protein YqhQ
MSSEEHKRLEIESDIESRIIVPATSAASRETAKIDVAQEAAFYEERRKRELHVETLADLKLARAQRETYARRVFVLVLVWILAMFVLLLMQGFGAYLHFSLNEKVLLALITSTTVNLIGTLIIVLKYIFRISEGSKKP